MKITDSELLDLHFKKNDSTDVGNVSLDADMLKLLLAIDARLPLSEVAKRAGISTASLRGTVAKLFQLKLIRPSKPRAPAIGSGFIAGLKTNMVKAIGPLGEFVVQDTLGEAGYSESDLPVNMAADIILKLSMEIEDLHAQRHFKEDMIKLIA